ncbi:hypothetical protein F2Q68_00002404, partial [Brassica cretica]
MGKAFVGVLLLHQHITSQTQSIFTLLSDLCHSYKLQLGNQFAGVIYIEREIQYWEFQTYEVESFLNKLESVEIHGYLKKTLQRQKVKVTVNGILHGFFKSQNLIPLKVPPQYNCF